MCKATTDAAEAEYAEREFVEFVVGDIGVSLLLPIGEVEGFGYGVAGFEMIEEMCEDVFDDGIGVGIGGVDDGDVVVVACVEVDVVDSDAGSAYDAEFRGFGEEGIVDGGVGSDDEAIRDREMGGEAGVIGGTLDDFRVFAKPMEGLRREGFGDEDDRGVGLGFGLGCHSW